MFVAAPLLVPASALAQSTFPFEVTLAVKEAIQQDFSGRCWLIGSISGSGEASQLGRVTVASTDCITAMDTFTYSFESTEVVLTVGDGDRIFGRYSGTFRIQGFVAAITGRFQISGGTGRFGTATGAGGLRGVLRMGLFSAVGQIQLSGTIGY